MAGNPTWIDCWSPDDLDTLVFKREIEHKKWNVIASEMQRKLATCYDRYAKIVKARAPVVPEPPKPRKQSLHEQLGIQTYVHRQAILCDPNGVHGNSAAQTNSHWYRVDVTLAKVFA